MLKMETLLQWRVKSLYDYKLHVKLEKLNQLNEEIINLIFIEIIIIPYCWFDNYWFIS